MKRFTSFVRKSTRKRLLPFFAYLTDHQTGCKFANSFETREQALNWVSQSQFMLAQTLKTNTDKYTF
jgi:hypothetical protein